MGTQSVMYNHLDAAASSGGSPSHISSVLLHVRFLLIQIDVLRCPDTLQITSHRAAWIDRIEQDLGSEILGIQDESLVDVWPAVSYMLLLT
jgi:hypothetical protein